ncbi:unnamed protein product [Miscanthus lutarioriparius]|uniref:Probable voltage-gated potassium channel subunit beta n=1 Tax=Miscanthus lutarioriparius TaxID=422564 RepID=A0A811PBB5_9POAL|nr:unnamed protein product [Miscanthus lutarioriparius]
MQYKNLGRSGLRVSQLSYGSWVTFGNQLDVKEAKALLEACRDAGVNFFDNAEVYANGRAEEIMGQAIRDLGWRRSDVVISTKLFWGGQGPNDKGLSRKHIVEGLRGSLRRLDMDYVDVVYCHRPDASTPVEETVRAMNWVIDQGWAFYWGTSEWSAQQITEAWAVANRLDLVGPIVEQPEYNLFSRHKVESEFMPLYSTYGIGLTTWSPLASGVLTGKYSKENVPADSRFALDNYKNLANRSLVDDTLRKVNGLKPIAAELGVSLAQLSIAWCASNPNVSSVITGATKESQIVENMKALDVIPLLTPEVLDRIEAVVQSKPKRTESYRNFHVQTLCEEGSPCSADHAICVLHGPMAGVTSLLGCCSNVPSDLSIHEVRFRGTLRHSHGQQQSEPSAALHWSQTSTFCPPKHPGGWRCIADYSN